MEEIKYTCIAHHIVLGKAGCILQLVESEASLEHSGFTNPLYNQDDAAAAAAAAAAPAASDSDRDRRPPSKSGFRPASWEPGNDTLKLVERDTDD